MNNELGQSICTDVEWVGRAHCEKCHIRRMMLFSQLPDSAFDHLLQPVDHFVHAPSSIIFETGSHKKFIYSIRRGMVKLVHAAEDGTNRIVRLLGPGSAIGLELLDDADRYNHTAVAINQVDLCRIPLATVEQLQREHPELYEHVVQQLQDQLDLADQWIVALGAGTAKQRVAQLLLILDKFFTDNNDEFVLLSREDMAAMIGITVETVSRMIAEFKRQKILYKIDDKPYICNTVELLKIAQQD